MKRRSWIILIIILLLAGALIVAYMASRNGSERLTQQGAIEITRAMERAFENKNVNAILEYIAPSHDTRIANVTQDQLRVLLSHYFRSSDRVSADLTNYAFAGGDTESTLQFDLMVHNDGADSRKEDYGAHIILHLRRVEVPHMLGLYQTKEWRITGVESTGADLTGFGD